MGDEAINELTRVIRQKIAFEERAVMAEAALMRIAALNNGDRTVHEIAVEAVQIAKKAMRPAP